MANIKFSDFTVGNTEGDIDFVVGYKGANNIQISPTNLLASALGNYLPLAGGTMTGDLKLNDAVVAKFGTGDDLRIQHVSGGSGASYIQNYTGDLQIQNRATDKDIIFQSDDGSGSVTEYFRLDGGEVETGFLKTTHHYDNVQARFGDAGDLRIFHSGASSSIRNQTGDLYIQNLANDSDIIFQSDDGAGGVTDYIRIDGSTTTIVPFKDMTFGDSVKATFGVGSDLQIHHDGTNSLILNDTGRLIIRNRADNQDIEFDCDDGAGGVTTYFYLDGGDVLTRFDKRLRMSDAVSLQLGSSGNFEMYHFNGNTTMDNFTGNLTIRNSADDKDILFACDDGSGGAAEYFRLDGGAVKTIVSKNFAFLDSVQIELGDSGDFNMSHNGTDATLQNFTGDFNIVNKANDTDIIFQNDDGTGGIGVYFLLDGSLADGSNKFTRFLDRSRVCFGDAADLQIYHDGTSSIIINGTGHLDIKNDSNDADIRFMCDDGSGGTTTYFQLDGSHSKMIAYKDIHFEDNIKARFGNYATADLEIYHDGTDSVIQNDTGDLEIQNRQDDGDIVFKSDDGSGGVTEYFKLDGSDEITRFSKDIRISDSVQLQVGDSADLKILHNATDSAIINERGNLEIQQRKDDGDIIFSCDDGSGGLATYITIDGGNTNVKFSKDLYLLDNVKARIGTGSDLQIYHNGSNSYIENYTSDLIISNTADDADVRFFCDDGSGGVTEYFKLDGSTTSLVVSASLGMYFNDGVAARFGTVGDLILYHDGSNSFLENNTGHLFITNGSNDGDVVFKSDDGSGGTATYFALDGGITRTVVYKNFNFQDNVKLEMGTGADLQIYHDGSNSFIADVGTGDLTISADNDLIFKDGSGNLLANMNASNSVELYFGGNKKFETTNGGVKITGVSEYADNTAALAAGLVVGDVYRTGDDLKIVH